MSYRDFIIEDIDEIRAIAAAAKRVAVLGIKPESEQSKPAHYVAAYLKDAGVEVIPVPVYYPELTVILGAPVFRTVAAVPPPVDIVDVFRRDADVPAHIPDLIAAQPHTVWLQLGIRHDESARQLAERGIRVIQDRCLMVDHRIGIAQKK